MAEVMTPQEKRQSLHTAKTEMGPLREVTRTGTLPEIFAQIGSDTALQIQKYLDYKISHLQADDQLPSPAELHKSLSQARAKVESLQNDRPLISDALAEYFTCLESWANGAGISTTDAWLLQDETFGCQTIMVRTNGGIILGHTEEWWLGELDDFVSQEQIRATEAYLRDAKQEKEATTIIPEWTTFIDTANPDHPDTLQAFTGYTFTLPGSAFGLHNGKIIAVDTLEVDSQPGIMPANVATWVVWKLAGQVPPEEVFASLGPFPDGYAYHEVGLDIHTGEITGKKIEFAGTHLHTDYLPKEELSASVQTNRPQSPALVNQIDDMDPEDHAYYHNMEATHSAIRSAWQRRHATLQKQGQAVPPFTPDSMLKELGFIPGPNKSNYLTVPKSFTYATFVGTVTSEGKIETQVISGPHLPS